MVLPGYLPEPLEVRRTFGGREERLALRWLPRLRKVLLVQPPRRDDRQKPGVRRSQVPEAVHDAPRDEDELPGACLRGVAAYDELEPTLQDVKGLGLLMVYVWRHSGLRRNRGWIERTRWTVLQSLATRARTKNLHRSVEDPDTFAFSWDWACQPLRE